MRLHLATLKYPRPLGPADLLLRSDNIDNMGCCRLQIRDHGGDFTSKDRIERHRDDSNNQPRGGCYQRLRYTMGKKHRTCLGRLRIATENSERIDHTEDGAKEAEHRGECGN